MIHTKRELFARIFHDSKGRIVLFQWPNIPILGWILLRTGSMFSTSEHFKLNTNMLGTAFLFTWAYLEITKGVNYFRKGLGLVVIIFIIVDLLR